ncbi:GNAT family N-acetyltransferase [Agarivorans sp. Toyoura001]|uniref:GNAT family N-acetyltransferase n=1 Tax=unclassified Agarivorans TaxID=2636026 RepID=UPI0010D50366|nr:GNAT family N-acetyltransferase [Agarivorans sp. Toyoura001]GDY24692.1 GNAT family N-acetyltransferase [Agarivorans sp. Toyoura001]
MNIHSRELLNTDFQSMKELLLTEGPNLWNYITEESINQQFTLIVNGDAVAVLLEDKAIVGFAILIFKRACPEKLNQYDDLSNIAYINDVVIAASQSGKGLGSLLLKEAVRLASLQQCSKVYIERHEENLASGGMMRKAGFEIVETFYDPNKRSSGSRNTTIQRISI